MKFLKLMPFKLFFTIGMLASASLALGMATKKELKELKATFKTIPRLKHDRLLLRQACNRFYKMPGFPETLQRIVKSNSDCDHDGRIWEIECALKIQAANCSLAHPECVIEFNQFKSDQAGASREFDIITNKRWIECKNICWNICRNSDKWIKQFKEQKSIASDYSVQYFVFSKKAIPESWQDWFKQQKIKFADSKIFE